MFSSNQINKWIKKKFAIGHFFIGLPFSALFATLPILTQAQTNNEIQIVADSNLHNISIIFNPQNTVKNLLVHITDSCGQTLFLDNQYEFSGKYQKSMNMKNRTGTYFVEVVEDNKHTNKIIELK